MLTGAQIRLTEPEKPWKVTQLFVAKQSDMDVVMQWRDGRSIRDLACLNNH